MNDFAFGNYLYDLRMKKGLTQNELGELLGVSGKAVSKWETGAAKPRTDTLMRLAAVYDLSVGELLSGTAFSEPDKREDGYDCEVNEKKRDTDNMLAKELVKRMVHDRDKLAKQTKVLFFVSLGWFVLLFVFVAIVEGFSLPDAILGPIGSVLILLAFFISMGLGVTFLLLFRKKKRDIRVLFEANPAFSELLANETQASESHKKASVVYTKKQRIIWGISSGFLLGAVLIQISSLIDESSVSMPAQIFGLVVHALAVAGMLWVLIDRKRMQKNGKDNSGHNEKT